MNQKIHKTSSVANPDERVREMFNGRNIKELMQYFDLARSTVYRIIGSNGRS